MVAAAAAVLALRSSDPPLAFVAATWSISAIVGWLMYAHLRRERERAAAGDHVVETSRDVAEPDHCVGCGKLHPPVALQIRPWRIGVSRIAAATDPKFRRKYGFRFCRAHAAPIVRLRRIGIACMIGGALLAMMVGCTVIIAGLLIHLRAGSSTVSILDSGGDTLLFRFRNQVYRNHFAELNGER